MAVGVSVYASHFGIESARISTILNNYKTANKNTNDF